MYSKNIFRYTLFLFPLYFATSMLQIITEIDVPELQLLASNLKPEECVKLISFDPRFALSNEEMQKLAREQSCFRKLVKWICQLRTVTKNTWPIVNDLLERIGRKDLVACLAKLKMKTSKSPIVIRDVELAEDSEDYDSVVTGVMPATVPKEKDTKATTQNANRTISKVSAIGRATFQVSIRTAGLVVASSILLTCCCTLFIRNRLANLCSKIFRRKKKNKGKLITDDGEGVSRSYYTRKPRDKKKKQPSYELIHTATQGPVYIAPAQPETPPPTGCSKCYKKKRKKSTRRPYK